MKGFVFLFVFAGNSNAQVAQVTVVADNAVEGIRALAANPHGSYQVLLWRSYRFLREHFKDAKFDSVLKEFDVSGAKRIEEWGERDDAEIHVVRYLLKSDVIRSHDGRSHDLIVAVTYYRASNLTTLEPSILVKFGLSFSKAAAMRDYQIGSVLDRVFENADLRQRARVTSRLASIEAGFSEIVWPSSSAKGYGFDLDVKLSDPTLRSKLIDQSASYIAYSGLEPLSADGEFHPEIFVPRDVLIPLFRTPGKRRDAELLFYSGGEEAPRHSPAIH